MPLNDLSLAQLKELADDLASLAKVGQSLLALNPVFNLTPGQPTRITLDQVMPAVSALSDIDQWVTIQAAILASNGSPTPSPEAAQSEPALAPEETPLAAGDTASGAPLSVEPSRADDAAAPPPAVTEASPPPLAEAAASEAKTESGGGKVMAAAEPPAAPVPGSASALGAGSGQKLWTEEEDARLVNLVATGVVNLGLPKKTVIAEAARILGRPEAGTAFRAHHKLKTRIDAALTEAAMGQAQTETPEIPETPSPEAARQDAPPPQAEVQGERAEPQVRDAPALEPEAGAGATSSSFTADPVTAHLMALPNKGGWTVERDHELMELSIAGWQPNEIALQLQVQANLVKPRFDALTGLCEDPTGKKIRRFTREAVFAALSRLAGKAAL